MICLELLGMSRSGKTTQKKRLQDKLSEDGLNIVTLERPKIPFSEFDSLAEFHDFLINFFSEKINANQDKDVIILDRGLYDRQVLLDFDYSNFALSLQEYSQLRTKIQQSLPEISRGYVFMISPEESLMRWGAQKAQGLDYSHLNGGLNSGDTVEGLTRLYQIYQSFLYDPKLQEVEGLASKEGISRKILEGLPNATKR